MTWQYSLLKGINPSFTGMVWLLNWTFCAAQVEASTKLFPAVFVKPTTSCMFQFEFGRVKVKIICVFLAHYKVFSGSWNIWYMFVFVVLLAWLVSFPCPECDASVCWPAPQPKVQHCTSLSSQGSGPATQTSFMDQAAQPGSQGDGGSARQIQRMENPMFWGPASHEPTDPWWKQVMHTNNNHEYVLFIYTKHVPAPYLSNHYWSWNDHFLYPRLVWHLWHLQLCKVNNTLNKTSGSNNAESTIWSCDDLGLLTFWSCQNWMTSWPFITTPSASTALYAPLETPGLAMPFAVT